MEWDFSLHGWTSFDVIKTCPTLKQRILIPLWTWRLFWNAKEAVVLGAEWKLSNPLYTTVSENFTFILPKFQNNKRKQITWQFSTFDRVLSSTRHMKGSPRNERVTASNSASLQLQHAPGYETPQTVTSHSYDRHIVDTAKTTTPCFYDRQIDYIGNPRDDNIGYYNQGSVQVIPPNYNIKSDPNNQLGIACGSKLDQNYSYEDVQLWS